MFKKKTKSNKLTLSSVTNFRELMGGLNSDGFVLKKNILFRSNFFSKISKKDHDKIKKLQIKTIVDFRGKKERSFDQYHGYYDLAKQKISMPIETDSSKELYNLFMSGKPTKNKVSCLMMKSYREYVSEYTNNYKYLFNILSDEKNLPLIFHCTAGKDRTGFASALILSCLNFSNDILIKDYLITNKLWKPSINIPHNPSQASINSMLKAKKEYINSSFEEIKLIYGNLEKYFSRGLNISKNKKNKIILNLMDKP